MITETETEQVPVRPSWVQILSTSFQPPRPSVSTKGQIQTVANQRSEGMQKQSRSSQETIVQWLKQDTGSSSRIYITISLSSSTGTKAPTLVEDGNYRLRPRTGWNQRLRIDIPGTLLCYLTTNQSEESQIPCSPWNRAGPCGATGQAPGQNSLLVSPISSL